MQWVTMWSFSVCKCICALILVQSQFLGVAHIHTCLFSPLSSPGPEHYLKVPGRDRGCGGDA